MPSLSKRTISRYFGTQCKRQLRFYLYATKASALADLAARAAENMPDPQDPRPGLRYTQMAGMEWERDKYSDLTTAYGAVSALQRSPQTRTYGRPGVLNLQVLFQGPGPQAGDLLIEAQYPVTAPFWTALGIGAYATQYLLTYKDLRPDIIEVRAPDLARADSAVVADGTTAALPPTDTRLRLRVIDIKHTAEPSVSHFAEVAYYLMTLAAWLDDQGLSDRYVVVGGAIWPGSHQASTLTSVYNEICKQGRQPTRQELDAAFDADLEPLEFQVFGLRIRHFLQEDLREALTTPWRQLPQLRVPGLQLESEESPAPRPLHALGGEHGRPVPGAPGVARRAGGAGAAADHDSQRPVRVALARLRAGRPPGAQGQARDPAPASAGPGPECRGHPDERGDIRQHASARQSQHLHLGRLRHQQRHHDGLRPAGRLDRAPTIWRDGTPAPARVLARFPQGTAERSGVDLPGGRP